MNQQVTTGIVLKRINFGEADRIITIITPDHGKLRLMAKGVRKIKSKLAGGIELFSTSNVTFIPGKRDISTLVSTRLIKHYAGIVTDINRTMLGYEILKMVEKVTQDECERDYFDLLETVFECLNDKQIPLELTEAWTYMRLLSLLGHSPNLSQDAKGINLVAGEQYEFDFETMAFFARLGGAFSDKHIKLLRLMSSHVPKQIATITDTKSLFDDCRVLLKALIKTNGHS